MTDCVLARVGPTSGIQHLFGGGINVTNRARGYSRILLLVI